MNYFFKVKVPGFKDTILSKEFYFTLLLSNQRLKFTQNNTKIFYNLYLAAKHKNQNTQQSKR